jgi:hypothetical protein
MGRTGRTGKHGNNGNNGKTETPSKRESGNTGTTGKQGKNGNNGKTETPSKRESGKTGTTGKHKQRKHYQQQQRRDTSINQPIKYKSRMAIVYNHQIPVNKRTAWL